VIETALSLVVATEVDSAGVAEALAAETEADSVEAVAASVVAVVAVSLSFKIN
jgi:hypothetical protein